MKYDVAVRQIRPSGGWEEWVVRVDAVDCTAALVKVLRRRSFADYLLEDHGRYRFSVIEAFDGQEG